LMPRKCSQTDVLVEKEALCGPEKSFERWSPPPP
jgi:hypothetical protein